MTCVGRRIVIVTVSSPGLVGILRILNNKSFYFNYSNLKVKSNQVHISAESNTALSL